MRAAIRRKSYVYRRRHWCIYRNCLPKYYIAGNKSSISFIRDLSFNASDSYSSSCFTVSYADDTVSFFQGSRTFLVHIMNKKV